MSVDSNAIAGSNPALPRGEAEGIADRRAAGERDEPFAAQLAEPHVVALRQQ